MNRTLLMVEDDADFAGVMSTALEARGFSVTHASDIHRAEAIAATLVPEYVLLDLKMPGGSGLLLIEKLLALDPHTRIVVLTGYATVTTAVEAIKLGAIHYLAKPVGADEVVSAFEKEVGNPHVPVAEEASLTLHSAEWQHIEKALKKHSGNISATARELGLHRRTLQRKLEKAGYGTGNS